MKKKGLSILLTLALVASLTACGSKDSGNDADKNNGSSVENNGDSSSDDNATTSPTTINVTTTYAGNDGNAENFQEAVKAWEESTGNKVNDASATSDETFKARVLADFEVGSEPDVLFFFNGVDSNSIVESGKVVSIDDIRAEYPDYAKNMKDGMLGASPVDGKNY